MSVISVSIVTFNTWSDTIGCVEAILASELPNSRRLEILVHDNGVEPPPTEDVALQDDRVQVIRSPENVGFGQGHNSNLAASEGEAFLVLNPDSRPEKRAIGVLKAKLDADPSTGAAAPQLVHEDGSVQESCRRLPRLRYELFRAFGLDRLRFAPFSHLFMRGWSHDTERFVDQPAGAALMLRSAELRRIGAFADEFPMYFEDVDLCRRINQALGPILFTPEAQVVHAREGTARRFRKETTFWVAWSRNVYYRRAGFSRPTRAAIRVLGLWTAFSRMLALGLVGLLAPRSKHASEARAKAAGYALFLCTPIVTDEDYWRRRLLHR